MVANANWVMDRADSGRTNHSPRFFSLNPPLSKYGTYRTEAYGLLTGMLVDDSRVYPFSTSGIGAMDLIGDYEGPAPFSNSGEAWSIRTLELQESGEGIYMLGDDPVLTHGMLVFSKSFTSVSTNQNTIHILGVDPATGEEVWRYTPGLAAPHVDLILHRGQLYASYSERDEQGNGIPALLRIVPGEDAPNAMVTGNDALLVSSFFQHHAAGGDFLHFYRNQEHYAFSTETLGHEWTYLAREEDHGPNWNTSVRDVIANGDNVYITRGNGLVYSLDAGGNLRWSTQLEPTENCAGSTHLSLANDRLILSGLCFNDVVALDPDTGNVLWREALTFNRPIPPAIHNGLIHVSTITETGNFTTQQLTVLDIETGEFVQNIVEADNFPAYSRIAFSDGHLYSIVSGSIEGVHRILVSAYEEEPADIKSVITIESEYTCALYPGAEVDLTLTVENAGPGIGRDTSVILQTPIYPAGYSVDLPPGTTSQEVTDGIRIVFGDMEPSGPIEIPVTVTLPFAAEVRLEAITLTSVRNSSGADANDLAILPVNTEPRSDLELSVSSIEVNQGIQDLDNSVPLVAERPTLVRVYPESNADLHSLDARLYITAEIMDNFGTHQYTDLPVEPMENCLPVFQRGADREELNESFNFILPPEITGGIPTGVVEIRAVLDPNATLDLYNQADATHTEDFFFTPTSPICLLTFAVKTLDNNEEELIPSATIPRSMIRRAEALLPAPEILDYPQSTVLSKSPFSRPYDFDSGGSTNTALMNSKLWTMRFTSNTPLQCETREGSVHYTGIIGEDVFDTNPDGSFNGYAMTPGSAMHFRLRGAGDTGINAPIAGLTRAHELGHNFFRRHVDCGDPLSIGFLVDWIVLDVNYPYHTCEFSPVSSSSYYGIDFFDLNDLKIISPSPGDSGSQWGDLMSYANNRWTSDHTWRAVFDKLDRSKKSPEKSTALDWYDTWLEKSSHDREVLVHATIDEDGNGEFHYTLSLDGELLPLENREELAKSRDKAIEQDSPFTFDLLDSNGTLITSVPVEVSLGEDDGPPTVLLGALLPSPDSLDSIQLVFNGGDVMAEAFRPANEPTVEITAPTSSATADENIIVEWSADHPDKDGLTAIIQYSADGNRWQTLTTDVDESPYVIDAGLLPGGVESARVRVIVSDGFNTASDISDPFTLAPRDPIVSITSPRDGQEFHQGTAIFTEAYAYDPEDGHLRGTSVAWNIEGLGPMGEGHIALLHDLPIGTHRLILEATDSDGQVATDAIDITILPPPATTLDVSRVILGISPFMENMGLDRNLDNVIDAGDLIEETEE
ncbi:MAG: PQQ-binding-like beta-propeller repeat protein [Candidatus Sumerlaeia bacterium]|nr:PQQ-binding-like beta-propeller repeat protein [Candidatus Sumerlaeia bacterium]